MYLVKTPWWLRAFYPGLCWRVPSTEKKVYLTFDDGPHETATPFVLEQLGQFNAKASFFCIGKNVDLRADLYDRIRAEGHSVGNHTQHHLNGWKVNDEAYLADISEASLRIAPGLFRPPYGRIRHSQARKLKEQAAGTRIIMWDVLSGDFDTSIDGEKCYSNVMKHVNPGSIIVFHDSAKAWDRLQYVLPRVLESLSAQGYSFEKL